jgi:hypothetical protein
MNLTFWTPDYWYPFLLVLGLSVMGLLLAFVAACDRV